MEMTWRKGKRHKHLPKPAASCCGVEARNRYMVRITIARIKAILEIVPYWVLKKPSAPSRMASEILRKKKEVHQAED